MVRFLLIKSGLTQGRRDPRTVWTAQGGWQTQAPERHCQQAGRIGCGARAAAGGWRQRRCPQCHERGAMAPELSVGMAWVPPIQPGESLCYTSNVYFCIPSRKVSSVSPSAAGNHSRVLPYSAGGSSEPGGPDRCMDACLRGTQ